ncbi:phytanoyl-CoA dioxygenase family protein [Synoicihabitans lomoniglobus]|uniref:Phytanoyl-CoA dioxygenase family protein n=1 Tax=Synoicihabitans lomoniglobus TaxID=2909285 RepID=A0AAF0CS03_9BACT|nr:phytanoyl-CoA dioxygenase family protein [Opitutaceae bacterium LMO-M01]WED66963.1 phytanoyl-CoA dioxygenase family protein [Opitutaceae bacterium LMO-M01]
MSTLAPAIPQLYSYGHALDMDDDKVGLLRDSSDAATDFEELRRRFDEDGYLYMKGYLGRDNVLKARAAITDRLAATGALHPDHPTIDGIAAPDYKNGFRPELTEGNAEVQNLLYGDRLADFYRQFYGEDVRHYDFTWLRAMGPGKGTNPHCDLPYMGRGTHRHMTCWVPYGDISFELGGLVVLEGSNRRMDLLENYVYRDVDAFCENKPKQVETAKNGGWTFTGTLSHNPPSVRNKFGGRWLTTEFEAGDFITFGMFLVHASLDNRTDDRLRISSDCRYQRASEPIDERWVGAKPPGHDLAGKRGRIC